MVVASTKYPWHSWHTRWLLMSITGMEVRGVQVVEGDTVEVEDGIMEVEGDT